jgi:chromo domain-containing protein 1
MPRSRRSQPHRTSRAVPLTHQREGQQKAPASETLSFTTMQSPPPRTNSELGIRGHRSARGASSARGKGATRGGSTLAHKNVFENRGTQKKRPTFIENAANPEKAQKHFTNMHLVRKVQLAGRERADAAPDISALPGGLFDPSNPSSYKPLRPGTLRRASSMNSVPQDQDIEMQSAVDEDIFGNDDGRRNSWTVETPQEPPPQIPWQFRQSDTYLMQVCYFWHNNGTCTRGEGCKFLHTHEGNYPVVPAPGQAHRPRDSSPVEISRGRPTQPPPGQQKEASIMEVSLEQSTQPRPWRQSQQDPYYQICYFWHNQGNCTQKETCKYLHTEDLGIPVAPAPPGHDSHDEKATCRYWERGNCKYSAEDCRFFHGYHTWPVSVRGSVSESIQDNGPPPESPALATAKPNLHRMKSVTFAVDEPMTLFDETESSLSTNQPPTAPKADESLNKPRSKKYKKICMHWATGYCPHGEKCWYIHPNEPVEKAMEMASGLEVQGESTIDREPRVHPSRELVVDTTNIHQQPDSHNVSSTDDQQSSLSTTPVVTDSPTTAPRAKRIKMTVDDYKRKKSMKALGVRAKEVIFGSQESKSIVVDFGDLEQALQHPWAQKLANLTQIRFDQMCMVKDLEAQHGFMNRQIFWQGSIASDLTDTESLTTIDIVVEQLRLISAGLISVFADFIILIYPAQFEEWKFLEGPANFSRDIRLRYLIFQSDLDIRTRHKQITSSGPNLHPIDPNSYRKNIVKLIHGLNFKTMLPKAKKDQNPCNFYLLFPSTANQTADFLTSWLRASKADCKIYTSQTEGSWDFFVNNPTIEAGVVFVHESAAGTVQQLPSLNQLLAPNKAFSFWHVADSSSPYPMFPSTLSGDFDSKLGQIITTRLFPHGHAFLLTPSFLVAEPDRTYELFKWFFRVKLLKATTGSWKLVCCHGLADYLLDLANSKASERDAFNAQHHDKPAKDAMAAKEGLSWNNCQARYFIHRLLVELQLPDTLDSLSDDCDSDRVDERESPIIYADPYIDPDNEQALVNWFAGWSLLKMDVFRRFTVVGTGPSSSDRAVRLKKVTNPKMTRSKKTLSPAVSPSKLEPKVVFEEPVENSDLQKENRRATTFPVGPQEQRGLEIANLNATKHGKLLSTTKSLTLNPFDELKVPTPKSSSDSPQGQAPQPQGNVARTSTHNPASLLNTGLAKTDEAVSDSMEISDFSMTNVTNVTKHGINQSLSPNILRFIAITGANANDAKNYLKRSSNNVDGAVQTYNAFHSAKHETVIHNVDIESQVMEIVTTSAAEAQQASTRAASVDIGTRPPFSPPFSEIQTCPPGTFDGPPDNDFPPQLVGPSDHQNPSGSNSSSKTSLSGIQTDAAGAQFVPLSIRPSASDRKKVKIRPGYVPLEDKQVYRNRWFVDGVPQFENDSHSHPTSQQGSRRGSSAISSSGMDGAVSSESAGTEEGEMEEVVTEIRFEPTTVWYKRLKDKGKGWENVYVDAWEKSFRNLGVGAK